MSDFPSSPESEDESHASIMERLERNWLAHAGTIGEALMRLIACQESGSNVNLSGIDRDLIIYAMARCRVRGHAQTPKDFPYQQTFDAIAAAVSLYPDKHDPSGISISVRKFAEAFNNHRDAVSDTSTDRTDCLHRISVTPRNGAPHGAGFACGLSGGHCQPKDGCGYVADTAPDRSAK